MGTVTAMYGISIFQYNQLGDDEAALNQGIDVIKECESSLQQVV